MRASLDAGLQTAFDLLGEMIKGNQHTLEMVDAALGDNRNFRRWVGVGIGVGVGVGVGVHDGNRVIPSYPSSSFTH